MARSIPQTPPVSRATLYGKMPSLQLRPPKLGEGSISTGALLLGAHRLHVTHGTLYLSTIGRRGIAFWKRRSVTCALRDKRAPERPWSQKVPHASPRPSTFACLCRATSLFSHHNYYRHSTAHPRNPSTAVLAVHWCWNSWEHSRVCSMKTFGLDH